MTKISTILCLLTLIVLSSTYPSHAFYDYKTGRWLNQDPIGYQDGVNLYAYVNSNPVNRVDPRGLCEADCADEPGNEEEQQSTSQSQSLEGCPDPPPKDDENWCREWIWNPFHDSKATCYREIPSRGLGFGRHCCYYENFVGPPVPGDRSVPLSEPVHTDNPAPVIGRMGQEEFVVGLGGLREGDCIYGCLESILHIGNDVILDPIFDLFRFICGAQ